MNRLAHTTLYLHTYICIYVRVQLYVEVCGNNWFVHLVLTVGKKGISSCENPQIVHGQELMGVEWKYNVLHINQFCTNICILSPWICFCVYEDAHYILKMFQIHTSYKHAYTISKLFLHWKQNIHINFHAFIGMHSKYVLS